MSTTQKRTCPGCTRTERSANAVVCGACWSALPAKLKAGFRGSRDHGTRVAAVKSIIQHLQRERTEPRLF